MRTNTGEKIVEFITKHERIRPHDLVSEFGLSHMAIHKQLKRLIETGTLSKIGNPPRVFYVLNTGYHVSVIGRINEEKNKINKWYRYISPSGRIIDGFPGFTQWVRDTKQEKQIARLVSEYIKTRESANKLFSSLGWIDATHKIIDTFPDIWIDKLLYQDFFALPKFGKTKLGQMVLYAKTSQSAILIREVVELVKPILKTVIKQYKIDAVSFIPASLPRKLQFMKELALQLNINLPEVKLEKVFTGPVRIAQKSLPKLEQRIENAKSTIYPVQTNTSYKRILLIDDAVGSGATFNETAKKLREEGIVKDKIIAYAIVGSLKGFDVISEI